MRSKLLVSSILLASACATTYGLKSGDPVPYPDGFREWQHVKSMVIQEGHPLHGLVGGIHHVYANPAAMHGLKDGQGKYADGAVFAFDLLEADSGGGAISEGKRKLLAVMHRDADAFAETGGWGFAGFPAGSRENAIKNPAADCFQCHTERESKGYVFTTWRD
jgi:hypothetical protein